jgi:hypothetical protein
VRPPPIQLTSLPTYLLTYLPTYFQRECVDKCARRRSNSAPPHIPPPSPPRLPSPLLKAPRSISRFAGGPSASWRLSRVGPSGEREAYTFVADDADDAERWVSACRQQALVSASELDLTPRLVRELEVNGFLEPAQRGLILNPTELQLGRQLGDGFYGAVYEGTWRGARVALKFCSQDAAAALVAECALHQKLDPTLHTSHAPSSHPSPPASSHPSPTPRQVRAAPEARPPECHQGVRHLHRIRTCWVAVRPSPAGDVCRARGWRHLPRHAHLGTRPRPSRLPILLT